MSKPAPAAHTSSSKSHTREQLIAAAEQLFAESGIDGVSLRQINVAAGQRNSSAAHYHFGSKDALILAIYKTRMEHVNKRRMTMLAQLRNSETTVRDLIKALILPIVDEIDSERSGGNYIRFMAQAIGHPQLNLVELWNQEHNQGLVEIIAGLRKLLDRVPDPVFGQRFGLAFEQIVHSLADREQLRTSAKQSFDVDSALFVSNLVDCVAAAMATDISAETWAELNRLSQTKSK